MSIAAPGTVVVGEQFTLTINAAPAPDAEICCFGSEVLFPDGLKWLPRPSCRGPGLVGEVQVAQQDGGPLGFCSSMVTTLLGGAGHAVLSEIAAPPAKALNVTPGSTTTLLELDFICNTAGTHRMTLTSVTDSAFGAFYVDQNFNILHVDTVPKDYDGDTIPNKVADTITISCVTPQPVGGLVVDLDEGLLAAAQPSSTSASLLAGVAAVAATAALALGGAAWYTRRRTRWRSRG